MRKFTPVSSFVVGFAIGIVTCLTPIMLNPQLRASYMNSFQFMGPPTSPTSLGEICDNGIDDDGDMLIDSDDPECAAESSSSSSTPEMSEICDNGIDDDGDMLIDSDDPECAAESSSSSSTPEMSEICGNGIDDNGDMLIDSDDPECASTMSSSYEMPEMYTE